MSDTCAFSSEKYDIASILTIPTRELEPFGLSGLPLLMSSSSTVEPSRCATSHLAKPWTWVPYLRQRRSKASRQHWRVFSLKEIKTEEHCDPIGIRSGSVVQVGVWKLGRELMLTFPLIHPAMVAPSASVTHALQASTRHTSLFSHTAILSACP